MKVKKKYTTLTIKVDQFKAGDVAELGRLVRDFIIPVNASVTIRTDATGTNIVFEWVDDPLIKKGSWAEFKPKDYKPNWYEDKPYYKPHEKP